MKCIAGWETEQLRRGKTDLHKIILKKWKWTLKVKRFKSLKLKNWEHVDNRPAHNLFFEESESENWKLEESESDLKKKNMSNRETE